MRVRPTTWRLLVVTAARNVLQHRTKSLIVGSILASGAMLLVVGTAFLDSVEGSMEQTVTSSLAGDLQLYSADADEELTLFGGPAMGGDDYGEIERFDRIRRSLEDLPNVAAVIPMGITTTRVIGTTRLDEVLDLLRDAVQNDDWGSVDEIRTQLIAMAEQLRTELENRRRVAPDPQAYREDLEALDHLQSDGFWENELPANPADALQFLDTSIAPLSSDSRLVVLRALGTDPPRFARHFDRFQIVAGRRIPKGRRGMLVSEYIYEHRLKNPVARGFDAIREARREKGTEIADSNLLQSEVDRMKQNYRTLIFGLTPAQIEVVRARIERLIRDDADDLKVLLQSFLSVTDANFERRYEFFYREIAPVVQLYEFEVGDTMTLQSMGQQGFPRSVNVRLWGIYSFRGLEDLELAGSMTLVDMVTFRELYGEMSEAAKREFETIQREAGVEDLDREAAEAELFGDGSTLESGAESDSGASSDLFREIEVELASDPTDRGLPETYRPADLEAGMARNAAVILENPERAAETRLAIERRIRQRDLGLKVAGWQQASGVVGQFVTVVQLVLYVSILIIFLVAFVIINNSMVIATVERTAEIGTMRAIGAPRWYVSALFATETVLLGIAAGAVGALAGAGAVWGAGAVGIPAGSDVLRFLFSGDRLYPTVTVWNVLLGAGSILVASALSTLYPARLATRIQPVEAMHGQH